MTKYKIGDSVTKSSGSLRLRQGEQVRFCCLDNEVEVIAVHTVAQRYRACLVELGQSCPMCGESESRPRMAMNVLFYSDQGTIEVRQWIFGSDKYRQLSEIKRLAPELEKHDLLMICLNETFQQVSFQISQTAEWSGGRFGPPEQVMAKFNADKVDLAKFLRTKYSAFGPQPAFGMGQPQGFGQPWAGGYGGGMQPAAPPPIQFVGPAATPPAGQVGAPAPGVEQGEAPTPAVQQAAAPLPDLSGQPITAGAPGPVAPATGPVVESELTEPVVSGLSEPGPDELDAVIEGL